MLFIQYTFLATACFARRGLCHRFAVIDLCIQLQIYLLVLRRRVSAKRRTIVFSTVRPSLQQIIELSKKFQVFYTFNGIIRPMNHVRLSVCPSVRLSVCLSVDTQVHYFVRTSARLSLDGFCFPLAHGTNIYWSCAQAYYF